MNNSYKNDDRPLKIQTFLEESIQDYKSDEKIIILEIEDEGSDENISYFVDNEGRYYYYSQSNCSPNLVASNAVGVNEEAILDESKPVLLDEDRSGHLKTVTLQPNSNIKHNDLVLLAEEDSESSISIKNAENNEDIKTEDLFGFTPDWTGESGEKRDSKSYKKSHQKISKSKGEPVLKCNYCDYVGHRRYLLLRHIKCHSDERPHKCEICDRGFKTHNSLQNHVNTHNGVKPYTCTYCTSSFTTSGELIRHVRYRHTHEKPHKCAECDYASVELSKLRRHIRSHSGERPYQCPHCTYASVDTFKLNRHLRTHTGEKPYKCENCNKRFTQSNSLKAHRVIHSGDGPKHQCEFCPTMCRRKTDLRNHIQKLHTADKPISCKRCGQSFLDRYSYKVHIKTHKGEKLYKCQYCPYATVALRNIQSHTFIHTKEKPFECTDCGKCFRQKQLLRRHNNLYHDTNYTPKPPIEKLFICPNCERKFAKKGNQIRHLEVHKSDSRREIIDSPTRGRGGGSRHGGLRELVFTLAARRSRERQVQAV